MRLVPLLPAPAFIACSGSSKEETTQGDDGDVVVTGCLAEPLTLALGTGANEFIVLGDGDDIAMIHGDQGGWHIDVAGRLGGTEQLVLVDVAFVDTQTGVQIAGEQQAVRLALVDWDDTTCTGVFFGDRVYVDDVVTALAPGAMTVEEVFEETCSYDDVDVTMTVTVTVLEADPQVSVSQSMPLRLQLDPKDRAYCDAL